VDYFKILGLIREPFSNSPEPEFFFQSPQHQGCLQKIELAIRLRRGLNIVLGEVGTGKTTLCRQLILKFSDSATGHSDVETHLLLDPSFGSALEFLKTVAGTLGITGNADRDSEWQWKESIKNYLFRKGVDEKKIVVLIIDEGQKLPDFCLEVLREFLNYETNEYKLLQIVIFAQKEFEPILERYANFADRINLRYSLDPLDFRGTRDMIRFRLKRASASEQAPRLFGLPALWAVYRETGGYPRKIITLCHQVVLSLIIQNKTRAGYWLVRSCAGRAAQQQRTSALWKPAALLSLVCLISLVLIVMGVLFYYSLPFLERPTSKSSRGIQSNMAAEVPGGPEARANPEGPPAAQSAAKNGGTQGGPEAVTPAAAASPMPETLGRITLVEGGAVWIVMERVYGFVDDSLLAAVAAANSNVPDLNRVTRGMTIQMPAHAAKSSPLASKNYWILLGKRHFLEEAYSFLKNYPAAWPPARMLPYWNPREGLVFALILRQGYDQEPAAAAALRSLPKTLADDAAVTGRMSEDTIFFAR